MLLKTISLLPLLNTRDCTEIYMYSHLFYFLLAFRLCLKCTVLKAIYLLVIVLQNLFDILHYMYTSDKIAYPVPLFVLRKLLAMVIHLSHLSLFTLLIMLLVMIFPNPTSYHLYNVMHFLKSNVISLLIH